MNKIIITLTCLTIAILMTGGYINAIPSKAIAYEKTPVERPADYFVIKKEWGEAEIKTEYKKQAEKYGVSFTKMWATVLCENPELDPNLQSHAYIHGVQEKSFGTSQIHLPDHPEITKEQATDVEFSAEFMAKMFSKGHADRWTCYRKLYGK